MCLFLETPQTGWFQKGSQQNRNFGGSLQNDTPPNDRKETGGLGNVRKPNSGCRYQGGRFQQLVAFGSGSSTFGLFLAVATKSTRLTLGVRVWFVGFLNRLAKKATHSTRDRFGGCLEGEEVAYPSKNGNTSNHRTKAANLIRSQKRPGRSRIWLIS